jgi:hypothetical protein
VGRATGNANDRPLNRVRVVRITLESHIFAWIVET